VARDGYTRFTDRARKVIHLAKLEARKLGHGWCGTGHLLLGLSLEESGVGRTALENCGVASCKVRDELKSVLWSDGPIVSSPDPTKRFDAALDAAWTQARVFDHAYIGTEHLLLGVLDDSEDHASLVFRRLGVKPQAVIDEVFLLLFGVVAPTGEPAVKTQEKETSKPDESAVGVGELIEMLVVANCKLYEVCQQKANPDLPSEAELKDLVRKDVELCRQRSRLRAEINRRLGSSGDSVKTY
jgi:ATP-dependent Clp protease ATP-binding subunit ClpA